MASQIKVFDEVTKSFKPRSKCKCVVVDNTGQSLIFGYVSNFESCCDVSFWEPRYGWHNTYAYIPKLSSLKISKYNGKLVSTVGAPEIELLKLELMGRGDFPYSFLRKYEAVESFSIFNNKQVCVPMELPPYIDQIKYTFGLEFETSEGYIPENICKNVGLIPLRDGSISGLEYSTVILSGETGFNLLKQQVEALKECTNFNSDCSLHIHFGGFPLTPEYIFRVYSVCKRLEPYLRGMLPSYTFNTAKYKKSGKDYCKLLPNYHNFDELYHELVGRPFFGSFTQAHPNDISRRAKWNIPTRYYWINFINALCYSVNKTLEFRFLRPTFSYEKIVLWIFIFNAILKYCEQYTGTVSDLKQLVSAVYPEPVALYVNTGITKLDIVNKNQYCNGDMIGADIFSEQKLFKW